VAYFVGVFPFCQIIGSVKYLLFPREVKIYIRAKGRAYRPTRYYVCVITLWVVIMSAVITAVTLWLGNRKVPAIIGFSICFIVCFIKMNARAIANEMGVDINELLESGDPAKIAVKAMLDSLGGRPDGRQISESDAEDE
jgi:hypothetical protein